MDNFDPLGLKMKYQFKQKCIRKYVTFPHICMTFEIHTLDYRIAVGLRLFIISTFSQAYALIR